MCGASQRIHQKPQPLKANLFWRIGLYKCECHTSRPDSGTCHVIKGKGVGCDPKQAKWGVQFYAAIQGGIQRQCWEE